MGISTRQRLDALEDLADCGAAGVAGTQVLHKLVEAGLRVRVVGDELADVAQLRLQCLEDRNGSGVVSLW